MTRRVALLVAESGGHLDELLQLAPRFRPAFDDTVFVTSPTEQAHGLLAHKRVHYVSRIPPRAWDGAARALPGALSLVRQCAATHVVSTGSAIAVPYLSAARLLGVQAHYIESAARTGRPSLTGQIVRRLPGTRLYAPYERLATPPWVFRGSVLDGYVSTPATRTLRTPRRVVVTLGTMDQFPFHRAVSAVRRVLTDLAAPDVRVLWQVGRLADELRWQVSEHEDVHSRLPQDMLQQSMREADLVIAHAGVGSALGVLASGHTPILLPRAAQHNEHVDDHQWLVAQELHSRGLAQVCDPDQLTSAHLVRALERSTVRVDEPPEFWLEGT